MKFLVIWRIDIALLSREVLQSVMRMADYATFGPAGCQSL